MRLLKQLIHIHCSIGMRCISIGKLNSISMETNPITTRHCVWQSTHSTEEQSAAADLPLRKLHSLMQISQLLWSVNQMDTGTCKKGCFGLQHFFIDTHPNGPGIHTWTSGFTVHRVLRVFKRHWSLEPGLTQVCHSCGGTGEARSHKCFPTFFFQRNTEASTATGL